MATINWAPTMFPELYWEFFLHSHIQSSEQSYKEDTIIIPILQMR